MSHSKPTGSARPLNNPTISAPGNNASPFPLRFERGDARIEREYRERCPECGATEACYSCVTQGGWGQGNTLDSDDDCPI